MELVYLWVEDYKNIHGQGFNFSPRFECSYDGENLTICDKKKKECKDNDYIENFFGKNINATAIVGENGSGKSSILKSILQIDDFDNNYIIVYRENGDNYYHSTIDIKTDINKGNQQPFNNSIVYLTYKHEHYAFRDYRLVENDKQAIINVLVSNEVKNEIFNISTFMYLPTTIEITYKNPNELIEKFIDFISPLDREKLMTFFKSLDDYSFHQFLIIKYIEKKGTRSDSKVYEDEDGLRKFFKANLTDLEKTHSVFLKVLSIKKFKFNENKKEIEPYTGKDYFSYFKFDLIDNRGTRYNHLSSGEQMMFGQLLQIFFYLNGDNQLLFLFDEPEVFLHPQWQKKYLNELITLFQNAKAKVHFIFTSHSPFLLSDLPKENVIFLEKDKETGNCINSTKDIDINPFGANIHTLLSHGFFMKDGLMGEFAKSKINEVIDNLQNKKDSLSQKQIKSIITVIGEPFLQTKLEQMYNEKFELDNELEELQKQEEKIKFKIEQLKKQKSKDA